ncbi:MAG: hypothetical protein WBQ71_16885 [Trebonia sp.]
MKLIKRAAVPVIALAGLGLAACSTQSPAGTATNSAPATATHSATVAAKPSPTGLSTAQIDSMVRTLYYGESQAYQRSTKEGFAYDLAHDYPGSMDRQNFLACAADFEAQNPGAIYSDVPELDTLAPDPAWVGPPAGSAEKDWVFAGKHPQGQTFILTIDQTVSSPTTQPSTQKGQVHVTILDGTAYFFESACLA